MVFNALSGFSYGRMRIDTCSYFFYVGIFEQQALFYPLFNLYPASKEFSDFPVFFEIFKADTAPLFQT